MPCLCVRFPSTSFFSAHWTLIWGNLTTDESRMRIVHTPFLQSFPTRVCGWGLYGLSVVTHDTTITNGPVYWWTWKWSRFLNMSTCFYVVLCVCFCMGLLSWCTLKNLTCPHIYNIISLNILSIYIIHTKHESMTQTFLKSQQKKGYNY